MKETIEKLEKIISRIKVENPGNKEKLLELVGKLKREVESLPQNQVEKARSMANFAESAYHEAAKREKDEGLADLTLTGLRKSVESFQVSHPELVKAVNEICSLLAKIGI